jgi:hypothetical protein
VGICHQKDLLLLPHATRATKRRRIWTQLHQPHKLHVIWTQLHQPHKLHFNFVAQYVTKQFYNECRSPPIGTCFKQIMPQISAVWARSQNCEKRLLASSCLSVRFEQLGLHWTDFQESLHLGFFFRKYVQKIPVSLKSDKNNGYFI